MGYFTFHWRWELWIIDLVVDIDYSKFRLVGVTALCNTVSRYVWLKRTTKYSSTAQQIDVHKASLCVLLVLEILCLSTKLTFVLTLCTWRVFHVFGCALSVYHLSSHWVRVCLGLLRVYGVTEHLVNSKWFQIITSLTQKSWTHARCWQQITRESRDLLNHLLCLPNPSLYACSSWPKGSIETEMSPC